MNPSAGAASAAGSAGAARRIARFELLRVLGRGAQATVWLAHDPRLDREVAIKLLDPAAGAVAVEQWLQEARAVSRLAHPHVVPVFEADQADGQPYLVFEHVAGPTLAKARRQRGPWPAREAVTLLLGVLDALAAAHGLGIVHRDLKPSNILLGPDGRARVMDFGIAARVAPPTGSQRGSQLSAAPAHIVGTPGYMSPEAARGMAPAPAMDVFAVGVLLAELLTGARLMPSADPHQTMRDVQQEDLGLPATLQVDERLRSIVQRALARDTQVRFDGARSLHAALAAWLDPGVEVASAEVVAESGTLDFLLRRMRHKTDFPALSDSVLRIQRVAESETESVASLSAEIMKDVSLTHKLLRMVNTVHYAQAASGGVTTVTRAVALMGFAGIRNMALSVLLMEHMGNKAHAQQLKEEFLRALMAGTVASELSVAGRESEDAYLASMFQNLGRLLTEYYFPEEAQQVRQHLRGDMPGVAEREAAARRVLGLDFDTLGHAVAKTWGLPDKLLQAMRAPDDEPPTRALPRGVERLRWIGRGANALTDALLMADGPSQEAVLRRAAELHAPALGLHVDTVLEAAQASRGRLSQWARVLGLQVAKTARAQRILDGETDTAPAAGAADAGEATGATAAAVPAATSTAASTAAATAAAAAGVAASSSALDAAGLASAAAAAAAGKLTAATDLSNAEPETLTTAGGASLADSVDTITRAVTAGQMRLGDVLQAVMQMVQTATRARCVVLCLRDPRTACLTGRLSLGADGPALASVFRVDTAAAAAATDLFAVLCTRGADILIPDAGSAMVSSRLPAWYRRAGGAATFLLLPMVYKGSTIGLIYADRAQAGSLQLSEGDMQLLRSLRDQAVASFSRGVAA